MNSFNPGDHVRTPDGSLATIAKILDDKTAVILVGYDSRVVQTVTLRKAE